MAQAPIKGRARINVTDDVIQLSGIEIQKPRAGEAHWGGVEVQGLFDTFQSFLLLPAEYTIIGVFFDLPFYQWVVVVESDTLPMPKQDELLPVLMPTYQRTDDGKVSLVNIQVMN